MNEFQLKTIKQQLKKSSILKILNDDIAAANSTSARIEIVIIFLHKDTVFNYRQTLYRENMFGDEYTFTDHIKIIETDLNEFKLLIDKFFFQPYNTFYNNPNEKDKYLLNLRNSIFNQIHHLRNLNLKKHSFENSNGDATLKILKNLVNELNEKGHSGLDIYKKLLTENKEQIFESFYKETIGNSHTLLTKSA